MHLQCYTLVPSSRIMNRLPCLLLVILLWADLLQQSLALSRKRCNAIRRHLDLPASNGSAAEVDQVDSRSICHGQQQNCCTAGADRHKLLHRARHLVREALAQHTDRLLNATQDFSRRLHDGTSELLKRDRRKAHRILSKAYQQHYLRHTKLFDNFYCQLENIFQDCDQCQAATRNVSHQLLAGIQVGSIKESLGILALEPEFQRCALRHAELENNPVLRESIGWLNKSLVLGLCRTCMVRRGLQELEKLLVHVNHHEPMEMCLEQVACMQSCACCSGNRTACSLKPCSSCCHSAIAPCLTPLSDAHELMSDFSAKLVNLATRMQGSTAPDHLLYRISIVLVEYVQRIITSQSDIQHEIEKNCGSFQSNSLTSEVVSETADQPAQCLQRQGSGRISIDDTLESIRHDFPGLIPTLKSAQDSACLGHSSPNETCNACPKCAGRTIPPEESGHFYARQSQILQRFQERLPELYPKPVQEEPEEVTEESPSAQVLASGHGATEASAVGCDDEDDDCAEVASGSGSGAQEETIPEEKMAPEEDFKKENHTLVQYNTLAGVGYLPQTVTAFNHASSASCAFQGTLNQTLLLLAFLLGVGIFEWT